MAASFDSAATSTSCCCEKNAGAPSLRFYYIVKGTLQMLPHGPFTCGLAFILNTFENRTMVFLGVFDVFAKRERLQRYSK
jgi:hypothetical protein